MRRVGFARYNVIIMSDTKVQIRRPKKRELPALEKMFVQAVRHHFAYFPEHYQREIIRQNNLSRLALATLNPRRPIFVAAEYRRLLGYVIAGQSGGEGHIFWLFVLPDSRGQNLGLKLLSRALRQLELQGAKAVVLNTHDHEDYYRRQGFKTGERWILHEVPVTMMSLNLGATDGG